MVARLSPATDVAGPETAEVPTAAEAAVVAEAAVSDGAMIVDVVGGALALEIAASIGRSPVSLLSWVDVEAVGGTVGGPRLIVEPVGAAWPPSLCRAGEPGTLRPWEKSPSRLLGTRWER